MLIDLNAYKKFNNFYINNGDGTFTDEYSTTLRHSSRNSMGSDFSDLNNDGLLVVEHSKHTKLDTHSKISYQKKYGGNMFSFFENSNENESVE